jgi:hypothetical protein
MESKYQKETSPKVCHNDLRYVTWPPFLVRALWVVEILSLRKRQR